MCLQNKITTVICLICFPLAAAERPNIVLILADDLGFSDLGSYGSEIGTPNLDALAQEGIRFSNYHTAASCAPTRAMLLTGIDNHRAGVPNIPESIPADQRNQKNYQGTLNKDATTIATHLKNAGYHTYMAGKWHLGRDPDLLPSERGFERTITLADTGADNWEQKTYLPAYEKAHWYEDGKETVLPDDFYSSKFFVDKTIEYIDSNADDEQPFFSYLAFQAVHIPVQAPREYTQKYLDTYKRGWDELRTTRYQGAVEQGVAVPDKPLDNAPTTAKWDELTADEQKYETKRMAVYAGMIDAMDHHIGRLVTHLKAIGEYENTIFIFTSDNGPEGSDPFTLTDGVVQLLFRNWMRRNNYNLDYETLGEKGSYMYIGPSFASAAASPFAWYKFFAGEGGLRVPMIISGVPGQQSGKVVDAFSWVPDLATSILSFAGVEASDDERVIGHDLSPLLNGDQTQVYSDNQPVGYEVGGNAALFKGDHKIVLHRKPYGDGQWHLYDLKNDPGETVDLKADAPELFGELMRDYDAYAAVNGVLPMPEGYDQRQEVVDRGVRRQISQNAAVILFTVVVLLALGLFLLVRTLRILRRFFANSAADKRTT